jgi:potassium uptake TrkH family protein
VTARLKAFLQHPVRLIPIGFIAAIFAGAGLLMLPVSQAEPGNTRFVDAVFTSASAIAVTGLITVDTPVHWSPFGQAVILVCIQVGGLGIMTSGVLLGLLVSRKLGLRTRLMARAEHSSALNLGDVRAVIVRTMVFTMVVEIVVAVLLAIRFAANGHGAYSLWLGVFHSVSAFNNAGFALFSDSIMSYATDPGISLPICVGAILGGLGMPIVFELTRRGWGRRKWSVHTKMTLTGSAILLFGGTAAFLFFEWSNPATFGQWAWHDRFLPAFFQSAVARTSGFNSINIGALTEDSLFATIVLMFIGGGSASTAGGIKVTTFFVLLWVIWAEVRGEPDVNAFRHRINHAVVREALSVALVYVACNVLVVFLLQRFEPGTDLMPLMFEAASALATVGQSTGITFDLTDPSKWLLTAAMYTGRIGPVLFAASLALRTRRRLYRYPEGRPLVG